MAMLRGRGLEVRYVMFAVSSIVVIAVLERAGSLHGLDASLSGIFSARNELGVPGMFGIAIVSNLTVLVQVPYTLPVLAAALHGSGLERMMLLGVAAGTGAAIGEVVKYSLARRLLSGRTRFLRSRLCRWMECTVDTMPRRTRALVFIAAASPLPDEAVIIPLAVVGYGLRRLFPPLILGKLVHNVGLALIFYEFTEWSAARASHHVKADLVLGIAILFMLIILYGLQKARASNRHDSDPA